MRSLITQPLRFLAPALCPVCGREVAAGGSPVCPACRPGLEAAVLSPSGRCTRCYYALPESGSCGFCAGRAVFFDRHRSFYGLTPGWRKLVHRWKFEQERGAYRVFLPALAEFAAQVKTRTDHECDEWNIVYIDSGREGFARRSFQPCRDLARTLSTETGLAWGADLRKTRNSQSSNTRLYRFFRVQGSLRARRTVPKNVLLLEDVFTTGATANEAARILKKNGANFVLVVSLLFREDLLTVS